MSEEDSGVGGGLGMARKTSDLSVEHNNELLVQGTRMWRFGAST